MTQRAHTKFVICHREEVDCWAQEYNVRVARDGTVEVSEIFGLDGKGAHSIVFNSVSVGVCFEGCFAQGIPAKNAHPTTAQWAAGVKLVAELVHRYGLDPLSAVKGHTEMGPTATDDAQKLQTSPVDYSCPGLNFPMDKLREDVSKALTGVQLSSAV